MPKFMSSRSSKLRIAGASAAAVVALGIAIPTVASATPAAATAATSTAAASTTAKPTVVLVHGAWADASSFTLVTADLQKDGYTVLNAPNPLRGLDSDASGVAAFINQDTKGPVVLVGHSYGGAVITNAALQAPTVKSLVFVDAYAPAAGESLLDLTGAKPGSALAVPDPTTVFDFVKFPGAADGDVDAYVKPSLFGKFFGAQLSKNSADVLASSQSPVTLSALTAKSGTPAWATLKSFFFVGTKDQVLPPAEQIAMAERAKGTIVKGSTDHLAMLEQPKPITALIEKAAAVTK